MCWTPLRRTSQTTRLGRGRGRRGGRGQWSSSRESGKCRPGIDGGGRECCLENRPTTRPTPTRLTHRRADGLIYAAGENAIPKSIGDRACDARLNRLPPTAARCTAHVDDELVARMVRTAKAVSPVLDIEKGAELVEADVSVPLLGRCPPGGWDSAIFTVLVRMEEELTHSCATAPSQPTRCQSLASGLRTSMCLPGTGHGEYPTSVPLHPPSVCLPFLFTEHCLLSRYNIYRFPHHTVTIFIASPITLPPNPR